MSMCDGDCGKEFVELLPTGNVNCTGCGEFLSAQAQWQHFQARYLKLILDTADRLPFKQRVEFLKCTQNKR